MYHHLIRCYLYSESPPSSDVLIGLAVFAALAYVTDTEMDTEYIIGPLLVTYQNLTGCRC